ncbi:hypothetical protein BaRGS_00010024, partial [Batillaria attramentaria]
MTSHFGVGLAAKSGLTSQPTLALQAEGCTWVTQDGIIDLSSLGNTDGTPRFKHVKGTMDTWWYSYNPCFPFSEGTCSNAAVCQSDESSTMFFQCGDTARASVTTDSGKPAIKYTNQGSDLERTSTVVIECDQSASSPSFEALGDTSMGDYHFVLTSVCACPNGCGSGGVTVEAEISTGTILVIIFLVAVVVYIAGGMVFNRVRYQKTGAEMVPNVGFWRALPGLTK